MRKFSKAPTAVGFLAEAAGDHPECVVCKAFLYLHAVGCAAAPGRYCCAHHAHALCDLPPSKWTLHYRFSIFELRGIEKARTCSTVPLLCFVPVVLRGSPLSLPIRVSRPTALHPCNIS